MTTELDFYTVEASSLGTAGRCVNLQVRGFGASGDDANAEGMSKIEVIHPLGFESRPRITAHTEAVCAWKGPQLVALAVIDQGRTKLTDLEEGETRISGAAAVDAMLRILAAGGITLSATDGQTLTITANGATIEITTTGDVKVNGGTLEVARRTDPVATSAAMVTWMSQVAGVCNGVVPGAVSPLGVATLGAISGGASHFKG